ncbi:PREDICTED: uncharacterized protein LOC104587279 isoform X2 [Nelumbo nucifera]|uniref:Uncharacterized protein LOC104587279 isoform X2 n=1 Tax=Nelumbo nucifera TaxID=4432 RepID=A0A1U7Z6J2_NELNU|nr:PREDICTED: uncharacterized protein LOC104587279 isoform X2 [Nelumbo nucifera]
MDQESQNPPPGLRHLNLKKSFKLGIRSLLTACSKEDFSKAFSMFNNAEQEGLHRLFLQVITSMHENIEEQFESICRETEVGTILDIVEQFVEEQTLDTLSTDKTNIDVVEQELSRAKKDEIQYLTSMLDTKHRYLSEQMRMTRCCLKGWMLQQWPPSD